MLYGKGPGGPSTGLWAWPEPVIARTVPAMALARTVPAMALALARTAVMSVVLALARTAVMSVVLARHAALYRRVCPPCRTLP